MDIFDYLVTHIAPLPWTVKGPGFLLMTMFAFRAFGQFFSLRWIKAATSLVMIVVVALLMARFGQDIAVEIEKFRQDKNNATQSEQQQGS